MTMAKTNAYLLVCRCCGHSTQENATLENVGTPLPSIISSVCFQILNMQMNIAIGCRPSLHESRFAHLQRYVRPEVPDRLYHASAILKLRASYQPHKNVSNDLFTLQIENIFKYWISPPGHSPQGSICKRVTILKIYIIYFVKL